MNEDQEKSIDSLKETPEKDKEATDSTHQGNRPKVTSGTSQAQQRKGRQQTNNQRHNHQKERAVSCCVCQAKEPKYKCPKCLLPYCSVNCCKEHKLEKCVFQAPSAPIAKQEERSIPPILPAHELVLLTEDQKQRLRSSSKLRSLLKNTRLQRHLSLINNERSERRQQKLKEIRENNREFEEVLALLLEAVAS